jgi:prepilin peptidase CpaA
MSNVLNGMDSTTIPLLIGLTVLAAVFDWRMGRIPNALNVTGLTVGLLAASLTAGAAGLAESLIGTGIGLAILLPGFVLRFTGAGDVKLFAAIGSLAGPAMILRVFAASVLLGGVFVIVRALLRKQPLGAASMFGRYAAMLRTVVTTGHCIYLPPRQADAFSGRIPLAPIFLAGTLTVVLIEIATR